MAYRLIRYGNGPVCPRCGWDQFDDWWHVLSDKKRGHLDCECGRFYIHGAPGELVQSYCWGVERH